MQQYFSSKRIDNYLILNDDDVYHIKKVMRMKENSNVLVVHDGVCYNCLLNKDLKSCLIESVSYSFDENNVIAYIPVLQEEKMSFVIEKGTEMGITKFIPVNFQNCKYKIKKEDINKKVTRWNRISKEAAEQSRRLTIPVVLEPICVDKVYASENVNLLCSLDKKRVKPISNILTKETVRDTISLVFGPEGGILESEENILVGNGFVRVSLTNKVLRTETVIVYVTSIIEYLRM